MLPTISHHPLTHMRILLLFIALFSLLQLHATINNYPWPTTAELQSDKYDIRMREIVNGSPSNWVDPMVFMSVPRKYADYKHGFPASEFNGDSHERCGGSHATGFLQDRSMSFVMFSFDGMIEVEITKIYGTKANRVDIAPKAFGINPHYFDGKTVRFYMYKPEYVSVDFVCSDNRDNDRFDGFDIKNSVMIFADKHESEAGYKIPKPTDNGVVVYTNNVNLNTLRNADIIYFPAGDHNLKNHKDNDMSWYYNVSQYDNAELYHGKLNLGKDGQKVYLAPGAYVRGAFHSDGHDNNWLYGRGIVSGRGHIMHEVVRPSEGANGIEYILKTKSKEAFCHFGTGAVYNGVMFKEAYHHTCPSGKNTTINDVKILGWCSNNDGIRPGSGSTIDHVFIKTSDDYDYARDNHTVSNSIFWPGVNGAIGQLGWNNLGSGYAKYFNNYVINSEWSDADKDNVGIINGSKADAGIKLVNNRIENMKLEGTVNYLVNSAIEQGSATGFLKGFVFKNITAEKMFQNANGTIVKQKMVGKGGTVIQDWTFTNLIVAGVLVTKQNYKNYFNLNLDADNNDNSKLCKNIVFNSEGDIKTITVTTNAGGNASPKGKSGVIQVIEGMDQMVSINPNSGKKIINVTVDGVDKGRVQYVLFENVTANHTVEVQFGDGDDFYDLSGEPIVIPPSVSITAPSNNAIFEPNSDIILEATATDDRAITKVDFYQGTTLLGTDATSPYSYSWQNVSIGTYSITAKAYDNDGESSTSNSVKITVEEPSAVITDINDLSAKANDCSTVTLNWGDIPAADGFRIRRKIAGESTYTTLGDVGAGITTYIDKTATENTVYIYQVRPLEGSAAVAVSNTPEVTTPQCNIPLPEDCAGVEGGDAYLDDCGICVGGTTGLSPCVPLDITDINDLKLSAEDCKTVTLTWTDVAKEDAYRIRRKIEGETAFTNLTDVEADSESYIDTDVQEGVIYIYQVRPVQDGKAVKNSNQPQITVPNCEPMTQTQTIELKQGWNLITLYIEAENTNPNTIFPNAEIVKTFNAFYSSNQEDFLNSLTSIVPGIGYLVYNSVDETITISGTEQIHDFPPLPLGWNLVGITTGTEISDLDTDIFIIKDFESFYESGNELNSLSTLQKGKAYFIYKN